MEFLEWIETIPESKRVFVDESGINQFIHQAYGWAKRGEKIYEAISGKRYGRENFIAGYCDSKPITPFCYQGNCNTEIVCFWLKHFLLPALKPGQWVIMDNAAFHRSNEIRDLITQAKCHLKFLPPYSPDLNPIEKFWGHFKKKIADYLCHVNSLAEAVDLTFKVFIFQTE